MKNPMVLAGTLLLRGFIEIFVSPPSSGFTSIASSSSFSFTKQSLGDWLDLGRWDLICFKNNMQYFDFN
jgi:hypothetical protein